MQPSAQYRFDVIAEQPPLSRADLLAALAELASSDDPEAAHPLAEDLLLRHLADPEIARAFLTVPAWYA